MIGSFGSLISQNFIGITRKPIGWKFLYNLILQEKRIMEIYSMFKSRDIGFDLEMAVFLTFEEIFRSLGKYLENKMQKKTRNDMDKCSKLDSNSLKDMTKNQIIQIY
jgi:hypothetical protein